MSVGLDPIVSFYTLGFIGGLLLLPCVDTTARFTQFPPNMLYVSSGGTARFVWHYHVDNRLWEFKTESPVWYFMNQTTHSESIIGADDRRTSDWSFVINRATCPPRLLNPDRVSRESNATLVITGVTTADNGIYKCGLQLKAGNPIPHQVQLVVTVRPTFLPSHPNNTYQVIEGQDLKINCTAIGPPTPNIMWVNITDGSVVIKSQGSGSAVLQIDNITRYHAGVYECQAKNNPNEAATTTRTRVTVYFKPAIAAYQSTSKSKSKSWNGNIICLTCFATGLPAPLISWYKPTNQQITTGVNIVPGGSEVTVLTTADQGDYGQYKCRATNILGRDEHVIKVTQLFAPGLVTISITQLHASSFTVRWTKPPDDGGLDVTGYLLEVSTKPPVSTVNTHAVITRLQANTQYTVKLYARNIVGYGAASAKPIRTKAVGQPAIPQLVAALLERKYSKLSVVLRWSKPADNGGYITRYTIYVKEVKREADWIKYDDVIDPHQVGFIITKNIVYGKTYKFMVTAWNKYGESVKDEEGAKTVNTTANEKTATNAMKYCIEEESTFCLSSAVLGVIIAILVLSLGFILLQFLYLKRRVQLKSRKESPAQKRNTQKEAAAGESYEIDLELEDKTTSAETASHAPQPVQTGTEYETIQQPNPNEAGPSNDTSNYQGLNLSIQGTHGPVYEPLRTRSVEPSMQHNDNEQHPYEPLNIRNQNTTYQSLQGNSNDSAI